MKNLLGNKNELEVMKLKSEFLEFQKSIVKELRRQQALLNEMVEMIVSEMRGGLLKNTKE